MNACPALIWWMRLGVNSSVGCWNTIRSVVQPIVTHPGGSLANKLKTERTSCLSSFLRLRGSLRVNQISLWLNWITIRGSVNIFSKTSSISLPVINLSAKWCTVQVVRECKIRVEMFLHILHTLAVVLSSFAGRYLKIMSTISGT